MQKKNIKTILFFGELPPSILHGISLSNQINLNILDEFYDIFTLVETRSISFRESNLLKLLFTFKDISKFFKICLFKNFDILYMVLPSSILGLIKSSLFIFIFKKFSIGSIVLHIHRGDFASFVNSNFLNKFFCSYSLKSAKIVISLSESQSNEYRALGAINVKSLPNTIQENFCLQRAKTTCNFLFISNYIPGKGIEIMLQAISELKNEGIEIVLDCYGSGDSYKYSKLANSLHIHGVKFHDSIYDINKFKALSSYNALIFPSINEGQPLIILEAMAAGIPVISSDVGTVKEMLGIEYPYLFHSNSIISLKDCINKYISDANSEYWGEFLHKRYQNLYNSNRHRQKLIRIFKSLEITGTLQ